MINSLEGSVTNIGKLIYKIIYINQQKTSLVYNWLSWKRYFFKKSSSLIILNNQFELFT